MVYIYRCVWLALLFCCSAAKSCLTVYDSHVWLYDSMDCSMPGFLVLPSLLEFAQTHVCWGNDAIKSSHPLSPPYPPAFSLSQHQGLFPVSQFFASGGQNIGASASASVLPMNIQGWFPLGLTGLISLLPKRTLKSLLQHHSLKASIIWCSIFFMVQVLLCDYWENHSFDYMELWLA